MNWRVLPDIAAVSLLICAFASTTRRHYSPAAHIWLIGWVLIAVHFVGLLFVTFNGFLGMLGTTVSWIAIVCAGELFKSSAVPFRNEISSRWMTGTLLVVNALYLTLLATSFGPSWLLDAAAALFAIGPLAITLASMGSVNFTLRWATVIQNIALSAFLLVFQHRPGIGVALAFNAVLFVIYFGCSINFLFAYRRATAGAFITIAGFMAWASGFVLAPRLFFAFPQIHVELEVWNLPKFLVALGMILLLLEDQIEHNKYLALHDPLTGLPNRRLFEDRMANALERAHRTGTQIALLVVDLDRFKEINDSLGHHMGDLVLERVASIFTERVRHSDTVSRTGGDEFSLILEESTNREEAEKVAASLRQLLEAPLNIEGHKAQIGASIGIAIYPEDAADAEALCIAADRRMYEAKHYTRRLSRNAPKPKRNPLPASDSSV